MRIAFVGGGTMAEAILAGLLEAKLVAPTDVSVGEPIEGRRAYLAERYGVTASADNTTAVASASMTVLAVKPQDLHDACADLNGALGDGQTVLSIIAGAQMARLVRELGHRAVVRVMPNTPAQVGAGMSVWTAAPDVTDEAREFTSRMLDALGEQLYVNDEKYLDMATALSASGPAFVWLFLEALIDGGVHIGLPRDMAASLATQTVYGSMRMSRETGRHPAVLRNMVTSPGGTTAEGLRVLEGDALRASVIEAIAAAYEKSQMLGEEA